MSETQEFKLYVPLEGAFHPYLPEEVWENDVFNEIHPEYLDGKDLVQAKEKISQLVEHENENLYPNDGLMANYEGLTSVKEKVVSCFPSVEVISGKLYGVAVFQVTSPLLPQEIASLKGFTQGEFGMGWGAKIGMRDIQLSNGFLCVSFWNDKNYKVHTKEQLKDKIARENQIPKFNQGVDWGAELNPQPAQEVQEVQEVQELIEFKLYSTLEGSFYRDEDDFCENDEDYIDPNEPYTVSARGLRYELDSITEKVKAENEELPQDRGLMEYYDEPDSIGEKVVSFFPSVEEIDGQLYGVALCEIKEPLTPEEITSLKEFATSQYSDGWGENLEQQNISLPEGKLNVHFWQWDNYKIMTKEEFSQSLTKAKKPKQKGGQER